MYIIYSYMKSNYVKMYRLTVTIGINRSILRVFWIRGRGVKIASGEWNDRARNCILPYNNYNTTFYKQPNPNTSMPTRLDMANDWIIKLADCIGFKADHYQHYFNLPNIFKKFEKVHGSVTPPPPRTRVR